MKRLGFAMFGLLCMAGCEGTRGPASPPSSTVDTAKHDESRDNSGVNVRDRDQRTMTPLDQGEGKQDVQTTADIRKRVVDSKMSTDAKNVKIITDNGRVTLRGPVKSADEKTRIGDIAEEVAGTGNVDNQLEIAGDR